MAEQHRATPEQWTRIERMRHHTGFSAVLELRDRINALEATQQAHDHPLRVIDPEREKAALEIMQAAGFSPKWSEFARCADSIDALNEAKPAEPIENWGFGHTLVDPPVYTEAKPNHPEIPDSSLERRVSEHIKAQSVLTAALVKRLEVLEGVPLDGAVPAKVPGGLPALAEKVKALEDTVNATTQPNYPASLDSSLVERVAFAIVGDSDGPINWKPEARAAIREVVAWLLKHYGGPTATTYLLEEEAER